MDACYTYNSDGSVCQACLPGYIGDGPPITACTIDGSSIVKLIPTNDNTSPVPGTGENACHVSDNNCFNFYPNQNTDLANAYYVEDDGLNGSSI